MKRAFFVQGEVSRCYLDARADSVRVGAIKFTIEAALYPCIEVSYNLDDLLTLSRLFAEMKRERQVPEIYFWDEEKPEPEAAVLFRLTKPKPRTLRALGGSSSKELACTEILAAGEANTDQESLRQFLSMFRQYGHAAVVITDSTSTTDEQPQIVNRFIIHAVTHEKPLLFEF